MSTLRLDSVFPGADEDSHDCLSKGESIWNKGMALVSEHQGKRRETDTEKKCDFIMKHFSRKYLITYLFFSVHDSETQS